MRKTKETRKNKGITLIALVITIIVLLILAGVSIATLTGNNGILIQANEAKENNNSAVIKEKIQVEALGSINNSGRFDEGIFKENVIRNIEGSSISENEDSLIVTLDGYDVTVNKESGEVTGVTKSNGEKPSTGVTPGTIVSKTEKNNYSDGTNTATIPQGFTVSGIPGEQTIADGLVIYDIPKDEISSVDWTTKNEDGAYNVQTLYNQFVWIPVTSEKEYQRNFSYPCYYYGSDSDTTPTDSTFTDTGYLPSNIQPEIDDATNNETAERKAVLKYNGFYIARYETGKENIKVISKQNATIYVNETQENFKTIGKTMYGDSSTYVKNAMCSGIQWDMVMKFVDGKKDGNNNNYDVRTYNAARHKGSDVGVEKSGNNVADKVQNIYDLESNCTEFIAEKNNTSLPFVFRGGVYNNISNYRASERYSHNGGTHIDYTFRAVLYIE